MNIYRCSHLKLNPGDIIAPGNWGEIIRVGKDRGF
jgi:hypothetical protein